MRFSAILRPLALLALLSGTVSGATLDTTVRQATRDAIYVEAGSDDGLVAGQTGRVLRQGVEVALVEVRFLAPSRASCIVVDGEPELVAGDRVLFEVAEPEAAAPDSLTVVPDSAPEAAFGAARAAEPARRLRWSGRLSADLKREQADETWIEPDQRLSFDASGLPLGGALRLRARRDGSTRDGRSAEQRVDELAWQGEAGALDWRLGRFHSRAFTLLGSLDGAEAGWRPLDALRVGLLAGREADPDLDTPGRGAGLEAQLGRPGGGWGLGLAGMRLDRDGLQRDRLLAGGFWKPLGWLALREELRLEKADGFGDGGWSLTHALGRLQLPLAEGWSGEAGLRFSRVLTPTASSLPADSLFDRPATREGSLRLRGRALAARFGLGVSLRGERLDGSATRRLEADASWASPASRWLPAPRAGAALQSGGDGDAWRLRGGLRWRLANWASADLGAGRLSYNPLDGDVRNLAWWRAALDGDIGRRLGWSLEGEWETGGGRTLRRQALQLVWRF